MNHGDPLVSFDLRDLDGHGLLRAVIDALPDAVYCKDRVGRYLMVNRAACESVGLESGQFIGQTDFDLPGLKDCAAQQHNDDMEVMTSGHAVLNREERFGKADGRTGWRSVSKYPLRNAYGDIVGLIGVGRDVPPPAEAAGEPPQDDASASDNSRLYRSLIESTGTGYVVLDPEARVMEANTEYVRLTGRDSLAEILGRRVYEWTAPADLERNVRAVTACLKSGSIRNLEVEYVSSEGRAVPVEINARLIETGAGRRIIALCRDVSSRRALEHDRQKADRKQQEAQRIESLAALAGGIGHDFNNLLTGVLGNASVAASELPPDSPALDDLEQIELAGTRAAELCKQLLAYAGKGRFVFRQVELNTLTLEAADLLRLSNGNNARLVMGLAPVLPPVLADAAQMRQVIMNVLTNAAEALETAGGTIRVRSGVKRADRALFANAHLAPDLPGGDYVFLEVTDDGPGIAPELRSRMFDPFFTTKFTARGLGLASVLGIVRGHNGALQVESEVGRGTTIRIFLPVDRSESEPLPVITPAPATWRGHGVVLVIDDEVTIRRTATQMLRALGFEVQVAADGHEGIDLFLTNPDQFVVVLLDLTMPRLDGVAVLRSLRDLRPNARVILMSGYDEAEVSSRFAGDRPSGFLQKPFRLPDLRDKLRMLLE